MSNDSPDSAKSSIFGSGFGKMTIITCTMFRMTGSLCKHVGVILAFCIEKKGFNTNVHTSFLKPVTFIIQLQYYIIADKYFVVAVMPIIPYIEL